MKGDNGILICIEGIDQSGKRTQVDLLIKRLRDQGYQAEKISFPDYDSPIGKEIKYFLNGKREYNVQVKHILYAANRWERIECIDEWLKKKKIVIIDRYYPSNLAYGLANGVNLDWLLNLEKGLPETNLVIIIDMSPELSFKRKLEGRDLHERDLKYLTKVREAYIKLSKKFNWVVLNGETSIIDIHENIWKVMNRYIENV